jgi:hypothetical protein
MSNEAEMDVLRVLGVQGETLRQDREKAKATTVHADAAIERAQDLLKKLGEPIARPERPEATSTLAKTPRLRSWEEIVAEARSQTPEEISFSDILDEDEIAAARARLSRRQSEFAALHQLTGYDYAVAGVAGIFAGLADILLVQVPKHPGFLGGPAAEGGWLSNIIKEKFGELLPQDTIDALEKNFCVPFDPSTSQRLDVRVEGLGPRTHRMAALGHDPLLGWYFGVRDVLAGGFTAIGSDGRLVIQSMPGWEPAEFGVGLFVKMVEAFGLVAGHMLSDVATPAGLPPPLFGLLQFFQSGGIGEHSIADIARAMYRSGYDLRHFLAGGVTVAIVEVFVRTAWTVRELSEGKTLIEALPASNRRVQSSLFLSHSVVTAMNAGKCAITQNPLSVNWAQWLAFFRYLVPQIHWLLIGRENAEANFVQGNLDASWMQLDKGFAGLWAETFGIEIRAVL